jgi:hypothetical protein
MSCRFKLGDKVIVYKDSPEPYSGWSHVVGVVVQLPTTRQKLYADEDNEFYFIKVDKEDPENMQRNLAPLIGEDADDSTLLVGGFFERNLTLISSLPIPEKAVSSLRRFMLT